MLFDVVAFEDFVDKIRLCVAEVAIVFFCFELYLTSTFSILLAFRCYCKTSLLREIAQSV